MPVAPGAVGSFQAQRHLLALQGLELEESAGGDGVDLGPQRFVGLHGFGDAAALDHEGGRGQGGFKLQKSGRLTDAQRRLEARGELAGQG
ncbi:hypothetical protein [Aquabacterium olei]|uniref:hypothetical protein n=1 Tax=Aquabacterium olei TaxID=1296669 RepID=UPI001FEA9926|nr:hypothetical protein [Aquabacterium olei]